MERRLSAVLISDVVGYTKLMESDTEGTVKAWSEARDGVIEPVILGASGRIVKFTGDGFLAEFNNVSLVNLQRAYNDADVIVLLTDHSGFRDLPPVPRAHQKVIDTRGVWRKT